MEIMSYYYYSMYVCNFLFISPFLTLHLYIGVYVSNRMIIIIIISKAPDNIHEAAGRSTC